MPVFQITDVGFLNYYVADGLSATNFKCLYFVISELLLLFRYLVLISSTDTRFHNYDIIFRIIYWTQISRQN